MIEDRAAVRDSRYRTGPTEKPPRTGYTRVIVAFVQFHASFNTSVSTLAVVLHDGTHCERSEESRYLRETPGLLTRGPRPVPRAALARGRRRGESRGDSGGSARRRRPPPWAGRYSRPPSRP